MDGGDTLGVRYPLIIRGCVEIVMVIVVQVAKPVPDGNTCFLSVVTTDIVSPESKPTVTPLSDLA